ncbi:hypothetical protein [Nocardiopsis rhodophaea]|uniref:hypothetical protein n=1 Tax=Nocardiopsis rhodophaea TaxID=280238 RepID=UPI0031D768A5
MGRNAGHKRALDHLQELVRIGSVRFDADHSYLILTPKARSTDEEDLKNAGMKLDRALSDLGLERSWQSNWSRLDSPSGQKFRGVEFILSGDQLTAAVELLPALKPPNEVSGVWRLQPEDSAKTESPR